MTFSHISDMHLGQKQYGSSEREEDMYDAFKQAVDISIKDHVEFVILAGDLFDKPYPGGRAIVYLGNQLKRLDEAGIPSYFILGEHDLSRIKDTPVAYVYNNLRVSKYIGDARPVMHDKTMIVGFDKIRKDDIPNHVDRFARADAEAHAHAGPSILVMHQGILEISKYSGEIASADLPHSFSYYAMGHLHDHSQRRFEHLGGPLAYPGSTEVGSESIRETERGFYQVDMSGDEASMSWTRLETRPHRVFSLSTDASQKDIESISAELVKYDKKPVVRITFEGEQPNKARLRTLAAPLYDIALYCQIAFEHTTQHAEIVSGHPTELKAELMRHVKKSLDDDALAEFVIDDLLPLLSSGKTVDALKLILDDYEKFKKQGVM